MTIGAAAQAHSQTIASGPIVIGELQLLIMQHIWRHEEGGAKSTAVRDIFYSSDLRSKFAYTTITTTFVRLLENGWLVKDGRQQASSHTVSLCAF